MKPFLANEPSRCAPQRADHALDLGQVRRARRRRGRRRGCGMADVDVGHQLGDRRADRGPVRRVVVAGPGQRLAQRAAAARSSRNSGSPVRRSSGRSAGLPSAVW